MADNRKLEVSQVAELATGLTYLGDEAKRQGLIDEIGNLSTATEYLAAQIGEPVELCWY